MDTCLLTSFAADWSKKTVWSKYLRICPLNSTKILKIMTIGSQLAQCGLPDSTEINKEIF